MKTRLRTLKKRMYLLGARYFMFWAGLSLRRWQPYIIAVTGSVGKTTMLHMIETQLKDKAHYSHYANSAYGLAFDVVGLRGITGSRIKWLYLLFAVPIRSLFYKRTQKYYVAEVDADRPKEAEQIGKWLKPSVVIWITSEHSHAVNFAQPAKKEHLDITEIIAQEYARFARSAKQFVIYDRTNSHMHSLLNSSPTFQLVGVDFNKIITSYLVTPKETTFKTKQHSFVFAAPMPRSTGLQLGLLEQLMKILKEPLYEDMRSMQLPPGRSRFFQGNNGVQIIDSTYNAHNASVISMVDMVQEIAHDHTWLVLGDIIDQGIYAQSEHTALAGYLTTTKLENIVLVGQRMRRYVAPILKQHAIQHETFIKPLEARNYLDNHLTGKELVLFKGSQFLEGVVEHLLADPNDAQFLCRREPAAVKKRKRYGL